MICSCCHKKKISCSDQNHNKFTQENKINLATFRCNIFGALFRKLTAFLTHKTTLYLPEQYFLLKYDIFNHSKFANTKESMEWLSFHLSTAFSKRGAREKWICMCLCRYLKMWGEIKCSQGEIQSLLSIKELYLEF